MASAHGGPAAGRLNEWARRNPGLFRLVLNRWPCFSGSGGKVTYIAPDWSEIRVRLPLSRKTRNYVGSIFGGSLYACMDPHFMFLLHHGLGPGYLVWDKAASIKFRKPGRSTLTGVCRLPSGELDEVRRLLATEPQVDRSYSVDLVDSEGIVHATVEKVVNVRRAGA